MALRIINKYLLCLRRRRNKELLTTFMIATIMLYLQSTTKITLMRIGVEPDISKDNRALEISLTTELYSVNKTTQATRLTPSVHAQLQLISICDNNNISLVLLDPRLLNNSMESTHNLKEALINKPLVSYGINREDLAGPKLEKFYHALEGNKYQVSLLKDGDKQVYHIFLTVPSMSQWIHLAIIYHRHGSFYWMGPLNVETTGKKHPPVRSISFPAAFKSLIVTKSAIPGLYVPASTFKYLS
ncbi:unnamed protein product, partial [Owenia fusiformis]